MSRPVSIQDSIEVFPTSFDDTNSAYASVASGYPITNGYDDSSSTSQARFNITTGSNAVTWIYYNFDCSAIPAGATINSVSCSVKASINTTNSSRITTRTAAMYTGTTRKGSTSTVANSTTALNLSVGSWTLAELQNAKVGIHIVRGTSNTTSTYYVSFYGATLTVNYTISGIEYAVAASSNVRGITATPDTQWVLEGNDAQKIIFNTDDIIDYVVTDNDVDVTNLLVRESDSTSGNLNRVLGTYTLVSGSFNGSGATYFQRLVGKGVDNTKTTSNYYSGGSGTIAVFTYDMSFTDIPSNATITRVYCEVNGHAESTSQSSEYMCAQLISGSTDLSAEINWKNIGTSNSTETLECTTIPTISQLENMKLQCRLGYYGGAINGATAYVEYTVESSTYHYAYTLENVTADHVILLDEAGIYIPPEEDPTKTYYSLTVSSINAVTNPPTGTTRVEAGTTNVITITPSDPQLTLALDNGVDITNQLVGGVPTNTYTVTEKVSGASYGFSLNSSTGYYVSTNNGIGSSASVCRVNFDLESDVLVTIQYINQGESQADYGMFGKIDTTVTTTGNTYESSSASPDDPQNYYYMCASASDSSTTVKTLTYEISAGEHYIDIKYAKDQASDSGNDSLQWKITNIEATSAGGDYTYTLTNISEKHSLIFVFGDVTFYYITSSTTAGARIYPDGQQVKLAGDGYKISIVPDSVNAVVSITDNNVNKTNELEREDGTDKSGNPIVNYVYKLTNIQAAHTLRITIGGAAVQLYVKENGSWRTYSKVYKKINGAWVEQADISSVFNTGANYVKMN